MRNLITLIFYLVFGEVLLGQGNSKLFFNEYLVSTNIKDNPSIGYGIGVYCSYQEFQKFNLNSGIELNVTKHFELGQNQSYIPNLNDVTMSIYSLTTPLTTQIALTKNRRLVLDLGLFLNLNFRATKKGTVTEYKYGPGLQVIGETKRTHSHSAPIRGVQNFGPTLGFVYRTPIKNQHLTFRVDCRYPLETVKFEYEKILNWYLRFACGIKL
jgi:hypothetical protein